MSRKDMEESWVHVTKAKKPICKGYVLYESNYMMLAVEFS